MTNILYQIEIPEQGLHVLGNIYGPSMEDIYPFHISLFEEERITNPFYWRFSRFWHEYAKKNPDFSDELVEEYWRMQKSIKKHRERGKTFIQKEPFFHKATDIKTLGNRLGISPGNIQSCIRKHLFGLVGVVGKNYTYDIPTGKEIGQDGEPNLGKAGAIRYTVSGRAVDCARINMFSYDGIYVPAWVGENVQEIFDEEPRDNGRYIFNGQIDSESLGVLKYIFERSNELRERYPNITNPYFSETAIHNATGFSKSLIHRSVRDTVGITAEAIFVKDRTRYHRKSFLPKCRVKLAGGVLEEPAKSTDFSEGDMSPDFQY